MKEIDGIAPNLVSLVGMTAEYDMSFLPLLRIHIGGWLYPKMYILDCAQKVYNVLFWNWFIANNVLFMNCTEIPIFNSQKYLKYLIPWRRDGKEGHWKN